MRKNVQGAHLLRDREWQPQMFVEANFSVQLL